MMQYKNAYLFTIYLIKLILVSDVDPIWDHEEITRNTV